MTDINDHTEHMTWCGNMSHHGHHDYEDGNKKMWCCKGSGIGYVGYPFLSDNKQPVTTPPQRELYEYVYIGNETRTIHIWLTQNEYQVANWALNEDAGITARIEPCSDNCNYRQLPAPGTSP